MRKLTSFLMFALLLATGARAAQAGVVVHANFKDVTGFYMGNETYDDGTTLSAVISVARNGAQDSPGGGQLGQATGFLSFEVARCSADGSTCNIVRGFGNIPSSNVGGGSRNIRLETDTSAVSGYVNETCVLVTATWELTCTPSAGGRISADWSAGAKAPVSKQAGSFSFETEDARYTLTGSSSVVTSQTTGTVLGIPLPSDGFSQISAYQSGTIGVETKP